MILSPRDPATSEVATAYPLRPFSARRIGRLRLAWFIFGTAFGVAVSSGIHTWKADSLSQPAAPVVTAAVTVQPMEEAVPPAVAASVAEQPQLAMGSPMPPVVSPPPALQATPAEVVAAVPAPIRPLQLPATFDFKIKKHETLTSVLADKGVTEEQAVAIAEVLGKKFSQKRGISGIPVTLKLDRHPSQPDKAIVSSLAIEESALKTVVVERLNSGAFATREITSPTYKGLTRVNSTIHSSLYQTAIDSGLPVKMVGEIIQAFSYDVDFQRDIHRGDKLDVVFESTQTDKNVVVSTGKMLYASLTLGGEKFTVYRHVTADGYGGYYNAKGESVRKALLRTPINGAHITSGFGMRMHPLLGYSKMHKGVDFGAPMGTPIYAAGDGIVEEAGRKGGYGNFVKLRHSKTYSTAYGHASRIARGIRPGAHVRQGQIIAYVGSTGKSTGPHLHYEILANNLQVNPSGVKFRTGQQLGGKEFLAFKKRVKQVEVALTSPSRSVKFASLH